ncbi:MAG: hypothetical protein R3F21_19740 [Myxococcota bacterium]
MRDEDRVAALLELAHAAGLEVRVLSSHAAAEEGAPRQSAFGRLASRVWVLIVPDDPPAHQAAALAQALGRFRAEFLEERFVPPALRAFIAACTGTAGAETDRKGTVDPGNR